MRIRLQRIVKTEIVYKHGHPFRHDTLECGHTVTVRRPTSRKDDCSIESAKFRRCTECINDDKQHATA